MKLEFSRQIFEKYSNFRFHENPSTVSAVVPCGRTDRHDEANSRFFCNFARAAKTDFVTSVYYVTVRQLESSCPQINI
jgi:hypothetical protein